MNKVKNLAETALYGRDVGGTDFILNGKRIKTSEQMRAALKRPTLNFTQVASGGFDVRLKDVPINKVSFEENVLAAGNWKLNVPKATVRAKYPSLTTCAGGGRTIFQALGDPSDVEMLAASRRHEDRHKDDFSGYFFILYWWDTELDKAAAGGGSLSTSFHGRTKAEAAAALFNAMGGTPDEIADQLFDALVESVNAYHSTPEGGPVVCDSDSANADESCSTSSVKCLNPS